MTRPLQEKTVSSVQFYQEMGGLVGRFILAFLAVRIVSRRRLLRIFQVPGLFIVPLVFLYPAVSNLELLKWGVFSRGTADGRAVQLLGKLSSSCIPHLPSRYRRKLRRECRRTHGRHIRRFRYDSVGKRCPG